MFLDENKFTGWKTYPIKLYDKKGIEAVFVSQAIFIGDLKLRFNRKMFLYDIFSERWEKRLTLLRAYSRILMNYCRVLLETIAAKYPWCGAGGANQGHFAATDKPTLTHYHLKTKPPVKA